MTVELFRSDAYRQDFPARITRIEGDWIVLDQTCFWPGSDHTRWHDVGTLGSYRVVDVARDDRGAIRHRLAEPDGRTNALTPGEQTLGAIDWHWRYQAMRSHTAQHLVDLALRTTHDVAGSDLATGRDGAAKVSFVLASGTFQRQAITEWVRAVIDEDLPMAVDADEAAGQHPIWHLDGHGHRPCDGLHVRSTGEIGTVHLHKALRDGIRIVLLLEVGGGVTEFAVGSS